MPRVLAVLLAAALVCPAAQAQTVVLVRHAEKADDGTNDPPLTEVGQARSEALLALLALGSPTRIVTSTYRRTVDTAAPTAAAFEIESLQVGFDGGLAGHIASVAEAVHAFDSEETVLVVGHSNTIPAIIGALGGGELPDIDESIYDQLFILRISGNGEAHLSEVRFGPPN